MKIVTCRNCGEGRPAAEAKSSCAHCGNEEMTFKLGAVTELINTREAAELKCSSCDRDMFGLDVDAYCHDGGWVVPGLPCKVWLSIACPDCNHETSFSNFGVPR